MRLAAALCLIACPALSESLTFTEDDRGVVVHFHNDTEYFDLGLGNTQDTAIPLDTSRGRVTFRYTETRNNSCEPQPCADTLEVVDAPEGMVAVPPIVSIPEETDGEIRIITFTGL